MQEQEHEGQDQAEGQISREGQTPLLGKLTGLEAESVVVGQLSRPKHEAQLASNGTQEHSLTAGSVCRKEEEEKKQPTVGNKNPPTVGNSDPAGTFPDVTGQPRDVSVQKDADASVSKPQLGDSSVRDRKIFILAYFSSEHANSYAALACEDEEATKPSGIVEANVSTRAHEYERRTPKQLQRRGRPPKPVYQQCVPTPRTCKETYRRPLGFTERSA